MRFMIGLVLAMCVVVGVNAVFLYVAFSSSEGVVDSYEVEAR